MTRLLATAALAAAALAAPALADDDELGAYLYRGACDALSTDAIVEDVGDLEQDDDDDAAEAWPRLAGAGEARPDPFWFEDEDTDDVTPADVQGGGYAVAIHDDDDEDAEVVACGPLQGSVPFTADLAEVGGSGLQGRVAVEADDNGIRLTTGAFRTGGTD